MSSPSNAPDDAAPPKKKQRYGHNKGLTKKDKPKLANRLPREKGGLIAPLGDGFTPFEHALLILGPRVKYTKAYYLLDGKPCNASDIYEVAADLKSREAEMVMRGELIKRYFIQVNGVRYDEREFVMPGDARKALDIIRPTLEPADRQLARVVPVTRRRESVV